MLYIWVRCTWLQNAGDIREDHDRNIISTIADGCSVRKMLECGRMLASQMFVVASELKHPSHTGIHDRIKKHNMTNMKQRLTYLDPIDIV